MSAPTPPSPPVVWFRREGRTRRGRGVELARDPATGCVKVDALWPYTAPVWVTPEEIEAAGGKKRPPQPAEPMSKPLSPIERMIDAACVIPDAPRLELTDEQKELCAQLGREVLSDLRAMYPDVVKTRPTTWPLHLRNTIENKAKLMLREALNTPLT